MEKLATRIDELRAMEVGAHTANEIAIGEHLLRSLCDARSQKERDTILCVVIVKLFALGRAPDKLFQELEQRIVSRPSS